MSYMKPCARLLTSHRVHRLQYRQISGLAAHPDHICDFRFERDPSATWVREFAIMYANHRSS